VIKKKRLYNIDTSKVDILLYLIYTEPKVLPHMRKYERALNATGVHLVRQIRPFANNQYPK
jgi:hypothetical protein